MKQKVFIGRLLAATMLGVLSLPLARPAVAQGAATPDAGLTGFQPYSDYELKLDGANAPRAELYRSTRAGAYLVIDPKLESPLLLRAAQRRVETVNLMRLTRRPDGSIDLLPGATLASLGEFKMEGDEVSWTALGHVARLVPRPWLLKTQTGTTLLEHDTAYARRATSYKVDPAVIDELKAQTQNARVLVFFGSWCPHCQQNVPKLLQVERTLAGAGNIKFDYYGLPNGEGFSKDPEGKKFGISSVPTGVVLVDGVEVGRFDGNSWTKIEAALRDLLKGSPNKKPA